MNAFDFINSISYDKTGFLPEEIKKDYDPYITVKAFTNHPDTVLIANALNCFKAPINKENHFKFLFNMVRKKKRYSKFYKKEKDKLERAKVIASYYSYSIQKAEEIEKLFSDEDIEYMGEWMNDFGGVLK